MSKCHEEEGGGAREEVRYKRWKDVVLSERGPIPPARKLRSKSKEESQSPNVPVFLKSQLIFYWRPEAVGGAGRQHVNWILLY